MSLYREGLQLAGETPSPFANLALPLIFGGTGLTIGAMTKGLLGAAVGGVLGGAGGFLVALGVRQLLTSLTPSLSPLDLPSWLSPEKTTFHTTPTTYEAKQGQPGPGGVPVSKEGPGGHEVFVSQGVG